MISPILKYLVVTIFLIFTNGKEVSKEDVNDFIQMLKDKVSDIEESLKIKRDYRYTQAELQDEEETYYDFIIVGGGSAGSALIHRLSEIPEWKILLLEAGGQPHIISDIPLWSPLIHHITENNWNFHTEKVNNFGLGLDDQRMRWPRGKILGGSSQLNFLFYSRGAKEDYDLWAKSGNPGWSYEDLLPIFKRMETCRIEGADREVRGSEGPVSVEEGYRSKAGEVFVEAALNSGYKYVDYNGREHIGVSRTQATISKGFRCSGESCYIRPIKNRSNLTIRLHSHVTKLIIENKTARGVEFEKNGKIYRAYSRKETILSAGTIGSAHILLLSGIGPSNHLATFNIGTVQDLPVGMKIYDHQGFFGLGFTLNQSLTYTDDEAISEEALMELYTNGTGILTNTVKGDAIIFTRTSQAPDDDRADIEIILIATHPCQDFDKGIAKSFGMSREAYRNNCEPYGDVPMIMAFTVLMHPKSQGRLELASPSYKIHPRIYPGFFTDPAGEDVKTMIAGIREARRVFASAPFDKYGIEVMDRPVWGCRRFEFDSDDYWECAVRHLTSTVFHHTTTCKMGPADDPDAVVDNRLRVYGVEKLRVADAAVIPVSITGHTNVPAFLIGEKAGDILKEEYLNY